MDTESGPIDFPPKEETAVTEVQLGLFEMTASANLPNIAVELGVRLTG